MADRIVDLLGTAGACQRLSAALEEEIGLGEDSWSALLDILSNLNPLDVYGNKKLSKSSRPVVWRLLMALAHTSFADLPGVVLALRAKAAILTVIPSLPPLNSLHSKQYCPLPWDAVE